MHSDLLTSTACSPQSVVSSSQYTSCPHFYRASYGHTCHELCHDSSAQFVLHKANDFLVNSHGERTSPTVAVATHVEPSLDITSDVFVEIVSLDVVNQGVSVHVTQLKILTILWLHVVVVELVHDNLTQVKDGLPEIDGFVHYDLDLSHLVPHQVLTEDDY